MSSTFMKAVLLAFATLVLGACAATQPRYGDARYQGTQQSTYGYASRCEYCGTIERIDTVWERDSSLGGGTVPGAVIGGLAGTLPYNGAAVPFIAVPTTAGTGSEATKNAVLSVQTRDGFKESFRHDKLVAEYAIVDPSLLASCPSEVIAAKWHGCVDAINRILCVHPRQCLH